MDANKKKLKGKIREYRVFLSNFSISCQHPKLMDYQNFERDIRFYSEKHQIMLKQAFFEIYMTSYSRLESRSIIETISEN